MKTKIKNLIKKISENSLAFTLGLLLFTGIASVYATWDEEKVASNQLISSDWNEMVTEIKSKLSVEGDDWVNLVAEVNNKISAGTLTAGKWCTSDGTKVDCTSNMPLITETDPQVNNIGTAGKICRSNGTQIDCSSDENDPQVGTLTTGKWCTSDGTKVDCTSDDPTSSSLSLGSSLNLPISYPCAVSGVGVANVYPGNAITIYNGKIGVPYSGGVFNSTVKLGVIYFGNNTWSNCYSF